jgi:uncharacterized protein
VSLRLPLFPLHTVLFPDGPLPLRVFEPRYLDMLSRCMKDDGQFGICMIRHGSEVGEVPEPFEIGTLAKIIYFNPRPDGLLGITVLGGQRFRILRTEVMPNNLLVADVDLLAEELPVVVPPEFVPKIEFVTGMIEQIGRHYANNNVPRRPNDASWLSFRLAELLPLELLVKQKMLEVTDPLERLQALQPYCTKYAVP